MYYFASDMHLGMGGDSAMREKRLMRWLDEVSADARAIFLVGDVFDFWFEYNRVVPKGFVRFIAKLSELTERGMEVYLFPGNHDKWAGDYLAHEAGVRIIHGSTVMELDGKRVFIAHGDNLLVKDAAAKFMNWVFHNSVLRWIFQRVVHPDLAMRFGQWWSGHSRHSKDLAHAFRGEDEYLIRFSRMRLAQEPIDYFVFGHLHLAEDYDLGGGSRAIFLGEWIESPTYAVMKDGVMELKKYQST